MAVYCSVVFLLCGCFAVANSFTGAQETFNVKPDGKLSHAEVKLDDGTVCVFSYAATGGTNEVLAAPQEWSMTLAIVDKEKKVYTCMVERPGKSSYLVFNKFSASILDRKLRSAEGFDNTGALLQEEDFVVDKETVKSKDGVQLNLVKLKLVAQ